MTITGAQSLETLPGVGPARKKALLRLGLSNVDELLDYFPREYEDRTILPCISAITGEAPVCFEAMVTEPFSTSRIRKGMDLTKGKVADQTAQVALTFFNQAYITQSLVYGRCYVFYGKLTGTGSKRQMINPYFEPAGEEKLTGGITPIYPLTAGISSNFMAGLVKRVLSCRKAQQETLPSTLLCQYQLAQVEFSYRNIHFPESWEALALARRRLIFEELLCLSLGLTMLHKRRGEGGAIAFTQENMNEFASVLPFSPTKAQIKSIEEIAEDLQQSKSMNRLLQGDVGSGKTVVAAATVWLAWKNGCQSALMAPTDLLARQHHRTMENILGTLGLRIGLLTGSMTEKEKRRIREAAVLGELDLLVGTHALLTEEVQFFRLALVITDEQHRFGVAQRAALSAKAGEGLRPHVLVMSATPIPRTLALMVYGDLDLSVIDELPPGRQAVETYIIGEDKRTRLNGFIRKQIQEGRQVYLVCPMVEEGGNMDLKAAEQYGTYLQNEIFPDLNLAVIHGKMKAKEKERLMEAFVQGKVQVLVSTTVIEVGVDVPNASLMIVENAERFGLSQLHQLRGRVGRGEHASYCVLISETKSAHTMERLKALVSTTDGFRIAEEDLKLRGPGDFFGSRQHGLPQMKIADLAGDIRILKEAQEGARMLLDQDPKLERAEHKMLREKVMRLFEENRDSFN